MRVGIQLDLRNPDPSTTPWNRFYEETLELLDVADQQGVDDVMVTEHHLWRDGYIPQPLTFLAAIAARTSRIRLWTGVIVLPLHSPVEIAEQAAVIDGLSGGRLELGFGVGYRTPEYELFGADITKRFTAFERKIIELREAWERVTPAPTQHEIPLWAGLKGPRGSRLAGRLGLGRLKLGPIASETRPWNEYLAGLAEAGRPQSEARLAGVLQGMLADDPDRAFAELAPRIENHWNAYRSYTAEGSGQPAPEPLTAADYRRAAQGGGGAAYSWDMFTPETAAQRIREMSGGRKIDTVFFPVNVAGPIGPAAHRHVELLATALRPLIAGDGGNRDPLPAPTGT